MRKYHFQGSYIHFATQYFSDTFPPNCNVKQNAGSEKSCKYSAGTVFSSQNRLLRDDLPPVSLSLP